MEGGEFNMSKYLLYRIDGRLVHGQVCTSWIPEMSVKRVIIIHDEYSKDEFLINLHSMVVPKGVICNTIDSESAMKEWNDNQFGNQNTIVIFQTVDAALKVYNMGLPMKEIQIATLSGSKNSVCIFKQVNVTTGDATNIMKLIDDGVDVYCQMFPSDSRVPVKDLLSQRKIKEKLKL